MWSPPTYRGCDCATRPSRAHMRRPYDPSPTLTTARPRWFGAPAYVLILVAAVGALCLTRDVSSFGIESVAGQELGWADVVLHILVTLIAVIAAGRILGRAFAAVGQPRVVGEVVAGIVLGPSLLGAVSPTAMRLLVPGPDADPNGHVLTALRAIAQVGIILYMFLVGLDVNATELRSRLASTAAIAFAGIAFQLVLGAALASAFYPVYAPSGVSVTAFALFFGVALSVTGFTVLTRLLVETGRDQTRLGTIGLACAAVDDVTAWCLVAVATGVAKAAVGSSAVVLVGAVGLVAILVLVVRPIAGRISRRLDIRPGPLPVAVLPVLVIAVLVAAAAAGAIGVHALFGAFVFGVILPHDGKLAREVTAKLKGVVTALLLPAFFALTGLRTEIGLLIDWQSWLTCGAILTVATLGKFGGTCVAARLTGHDWRSAAALGAMMNTRGLMGLIVLDIGLGLGVISPALFAMMVVTALVTTLATAPLLKRLAPHDASTSTT